MEEGAWPAVILAGESAARVEMGVDATGASGDAEERLEAEPASEGVETAGTAPDEETVSATPTAAKGSAGEEKPAAPCAAGDPALIARLEQGLRNKSAAVRRQAARQLKELTGRDYDAQGANAQEANV